MKEREKKMERKYFIAKIKNDDDRDCVKYLEFDKDNDTRIHICGACFCGLTKKRYTRDFEQL